MAWTTSKEELRDVLNDGDNDKLCHRKRVIGQINGTNINFKTFEARRVTNFFTGSAYPFGVFKNDSSTPEAIVADSTETGDFQLVTPPTEGSILEASYYHRYFLDDELTSFISAAIRWLGSTTNPDSVVAGLQPAVLKYAAGEAYERLGQKYIEHMSATYRTEDAPDEKQGTLGQAFLDMSLKFREQALKLRDEFYTRQGQALQPLFENIAGNVRDVPPRR